MEELFIQILKQIEQNPTESVDEAIKAVAIEMGIGDADLAEIASALELLDVTNEKAIALEETRKEGVTRNGWIQQQMSDIAAKSGMDVEAIAKEIEDGTEIGFDNTVSQ